jgi:hypothetical protein
MEACVKPLPENARAGLFLAQLKDKCYLFLIGNNSLVNDGERQ